MTLAAVKKLIAEPFDADRVRIRAAALCLSLTLSTTVVSNETVTAAQPLPTLHSDCVLGDAESTRRRITQGMNVNEKEPRFEAMPLHYACAMRRTKIVSMLLDAGAQPNVRDGRGDTPLHWLGIPVESVHYVEALLDADNRLVADLRIPTLVFQMLERRHPKPTIPTSLRASDHARRAEIARLMLVHGADPDLRGKDKKPATDWLMKEKVISECLARPDKRSILGQDIEDVDPLEGLILYCALDDLPRIAYFLGRLEELDVRDQQGTTPLAEACMAGNLGLVQQLLSRGANPNFAHGDGRYPIHVSCEMKRPDIAQLLLNCGADFTVASTTGITPLDIVRQQKRVPRSPQPQDFPHWVKIHLRAQIHQVLAETRELMRQGHRKVMNDLVDRGLFYRRFQGPAEAAGMFNVTVPWKTRLMLSLEDEWAHYREQAAMPRSAGKRPVETAEFDFVDSNVVVALALAEICYPNMGTEYKWIVRRTFEAAEKWEKIESEGLLQLGASSSDAVLAEVHGHFDSLERDDEAFLRRGTTEAIGRYVRRSAIHAQAGFVRFYDFNLLDASSGRSVLHRYWGDDERDGLNYLLSHGASQDCADDKGRSLLSWLCSSRTEFPLRCVELAIDHGATVDQTDAMGMTPLHRAAQNGQLSAVQWLMDHGAEVDARDITGVTPFVIAAWAGKVTSLPLLLDAGASINSKANDGRTALMFIAGKERTSEATLAAVEFLLQNGSDADALDKEGKPALAYAVGRRNRQMIERLLKAGADPNAGSGRGRTALAWGIERLKDTKEDLKLIEWLIEQGADVDAPDAKGVTPLMLAAKFGNVAKSRLLVESGATITRKDSNGKCADHYIPPFVTDEVRRELFWLLRSNMDPFD